MAQRRSKKIKMKITFAGVTLLAVMLICFASPNKATDIQTDREEPLVVAAAYAKDRVVSVGVYDRLKRPTLLYMGSGFFVGDGHHVATNAHVVDAVLKHSDAQHMRVFLKSDRAPHGRPAQVVAIDRLHDVAILKVAGRKSPTFSLDIKRPMTGRGICVMGYPIGAILGFEPLFHDGTISAVVPAVKPMPRGVKLTERLKKHIQNPYNMYQLNIIMYPGNSGSVLIDTRTRKAIGIINSVMGRGIREHLVSHPTGISYAIPSKWIKRLLLQQRIPSP